MKRQSNAVVRLQSSGDFGKTWFNVGGPIVGEDYRLVAGRYREYAKSCGIGYVRVISVETHVLIDLSPAEDDENGK